MMKNLNNLNIQNFATLSDQLKKEVYKYVNDQLRDADFKQNLLLELRLKSLKALCEIEYYERQSDQWMVDNKNVELAEYVVLELMHSTYLENQQDDVKKYEIVEVSFEQLQVIRAAFESYISLFNSYDKLPEGQSLERITNFIKEVVKVLITTRDIINTGLKQILDTYSVIYSYEIQQEIIDIQEEYQNELFLGSIQKKSPLSYINDSIFSNWYRMLINLNMLEDLAKLQSWVQIYDKYAHHLYNLTLKMNEQVNRWLTEGISDDNCGFYMKILEISNIIERNGLIVPKDIEDVLTILNNVFQKSRTHDERSEPKHVRYERTLELSKNYTQEDLKSNFRKLAMKFHPDTSSLPQEEAAEKMKVINEAHIYLKQYNGWD